MRCLPKRQSGRQLASPVVYPPLTSAEVEDVANRA